MAYYVQVVCYYGENCIVLSSCIVVLVYFEDPFTIACIAFFKGTLEVFAKRCECWGNGDIVFLVDAKDKVIFFIFTGKAMDKAGFYVFAAMINAGCICVVKVYYFKWVVF